MTTDNFRVVNKKDFGAHLMPSFIGMMHTGTEIYLEGDEATTMRQCDGSGEDPTCSYQWEWKHWTWSAIDHTVYFGVHMKDWDFENNCDSVYPFDLSAKQQMIDNTDDLYKQSLSAWTKF